MPLRQSLNGLIDMAWYEVFAQWMYWCWQRIWPFDDSRRDGRNEDDLTSLTDKMLFAHKPTGVVRRFLY
jgi:hypothetical protein